MNKYRCNNCGNEYKAEKAYDHLILGIVCNSCFTGNRNLVESEWS